MALLLTAVCSGIRRGIRGCRTPARGSALMLEANRSRQLLLAWLQSLGSAVQ